MAEDESKKEYYLQNVDGKLSIVPMATGTVTYVTSSAVTSGDSQTYNMVRDTLLNENGQTKLPMEIPPIGNIGEISATLNEEVPKLPLSAIDHIAVEALVNIRANDIANNSSAGKKENTSFYFAVLFCLIGLLMITLGLFGLLSSDVWERVIVSGNGGLLSFIGKWIFDFYKETSNSRKSALEKTNRRERDFILLSLIRDPEKRDDALFELIQNSK
jgi:hypothetical protein